LLFMQVDLCMHRHADAERMCCELLGIEFDTYWHPLHDLDLVACRILGRQQGKRGAGSCGKSDYLAVIFHAAAVNIRYKFYQLAYAYLA